jgi:radical S-adenosyl methionine domain-containing protein 2
MHVRAKTLLPLRRVLRARTSLYYRETPSVNYHLWQACNMACKFCFATFQDMKDTILPAGHLSREESMLMVKHLADAGFQKINFAGGEPFLCAWLEDLVDLAKECGMTTSVVTNGSLFHRAKVQKMLHKLDWFVLSVDSLDPETLRKIGRVTRNGPMSEDDYLAICAKVRDAEVRLKINTVVTSANCDEDLNSFIVRARPHRWKIMQMLAVDGPDSRYDEDLLVGRRRFARAVRRGRKVELRGIRVVAERSQDMVGSYVMVDPAGRFYDNIGGEYAYSKPIPEVGVEEALAQVQVSHWKFSARGGHYPL